MKVKGVGTASLAIVVVIAVVAIGAGYYFLAGAGEDGGENVGDGGDGGDGGDEVTIQLVYDDFNDGNSGTNLGGQAGPMSPDELYDPTVTFTSGTDAYEGAYALSLQYDFPSGQWCGYWSFFKADESGYDVSGYTALVMWTKGATGGETFKIELKDTAGGASYRYVTVSGTEYEKVVVRFSDFIQIPWEPSPADLTKLKQVNIVFDTSPLSGTVYIDQIGFGS